MLPNPERETVTIQRAASLTGVSRRTIYYWIAAGKVEYVRTAGGSIRVFVDTLWKQAAGPAGGAETKLPGKGTTNDSPRNGAS